MLAVGRSRRYHHRRLFEKRLPGFRLVRYEPHTPLLYWLSGGLKKWSLLPYSLIGTVKKIEDLLLRISPEFASFVDVELVKEPNGFSF